jgi:hypothetical protein
VLQHYGLEAEGGWRGIHTEGGVWAALFGLLFWDVLFSGAAARRGGPPARARSPALRLPLPPVPHRAASSLACRPHLNTRPLPHLLPLPHPLPDVPGVFQSPFQSAPLDLDTDAFFPSRAAAIEARLQEIALGGAGGRPRGGGLACLPRPRWQPHLLACARLAASPHAGGQPQAPDAEPQLPPTSPLPLAPAPPGALIQEVWAAHYGELCRGVGWARFELGQLVEIAECVGGVGLSVVLRLMAEDHEGSSGKVGAGGGVRD